ncbi:hypothetical protein HZI73_08855 [Vallitalea pronyensis]|uniref:1-alkyl-2-acetylglycerophosphocholine esterase n=1 Tax=Vallitalea pronyensis TaxID=1348613 RepID=A0A8J8MJH2_9FIRM|nr:hypothetical protein [Vallitalea pronyensis]QUI22403.1 hypothetical protein HZI73_08855 [Vallitalea pronyensis]
MFGNVKELPKPVGTYTVGITQMVLTDKTRKQVFPFEDKDAYRNVPITVFYPSDSSEGLIGAPYAFPEALEVLHKMTQGFWSKHMVKLKTQVYENIAISQKKESYPIIFFNHGYPAYEMQNTVLCSDLASLGYIVISVGHLYESSAIQYKDGRVVKVHKANVKRLKKSTNMTYKRKLIKVLRDKRKNYSDKKAMELAEFLFIKEGAELSHTVKIWADDTLFIADQLEAIHDGKIPSLFKNKLQIDRGFGITGHSLGGAVSAQVCYRDKRFIGGINIDGGNWGDYLYQDMKTPFMVLGSFVMRNIARTTFRYNSKDAYFILLDKTSHWGFCDVLFGSRQAVLKGMVGLREKYDFRDIITKYHAYFFEKYLLGHDDVQLNPLRFEGVEYKEKIQPVM